MRILLVEDEENIRDLIQLNLEAEGYEVVSTGNGRKALDLIGGQHFDLLLLDVMLPEVDGFSITEQVRLSNHEVPILILTAKDMAQDRIAGLKRGADDYLTKPFNLEELLLREMLSVTLSFDHDVVDGAPAARFGERLKGVLERGYGLEETVGRI